MTAARRIVDAAISPVALYRPNRAEGCCLAHLLLLPGLEATIPSADSANLRLANHYDTIKPPAGLDPKRALAHVLAFHSVGVMTHSTLALRTHWSSPLWRNLQLDALAALSQSSKGE